MKSKLLAALVLLSPVLLASCSRYQVNVLNSNNTVKDKSTGVFNFENDTVKITYSFYGKNAPVNIEVFNKLDKPVYVDWDSSAITVGDSTVSYADRQVPINGSISSISSQYQQRSRVWPNTVGYSSGSISGTATMPQNSVFIAPHAKVGNVPLNLADGFLNVADSTMRKEKLAYTYARGAGVAAVKTVNFNQDNSPLKLRSFITLYIGDSNNLKPVLYQHSFYLSALYDMLYDPNDLQQFEQKRGDYFIITKKTGYGKAMSGVGVAVVVGGVVAADAALSKPDRQK